MLQIMRAESNRDRAVKAITIKKTRNRKKGDINRWKGMHKEIRRKYMKSSSQDG